MCAAYSLACGRQDWKQMGGQSVRGLSAPDALREDDTSSCVRSRVWAHAHVAILVRGVRKLVSILIQTRCVTFPSGLLL